MKYTGQELAIAMQEAIKQEINSGSIEGSEYYRKIQKGIAHKINNRLEYLRGEIKAERISTGEIGELQALSKYIMFDDVELLEWAGVPEKF